MALHLHTGLSGIADRLRRAMGRFIHSGEGIRGFDNLPNTNFNYQGKIVPMLNSAVAATAFWMSRNFPQAPLAIWEEDDDGNLSIIAKHPVSELIRHPNPFYTGTLMWFSSILEFVIAGNAYWIKERNEDGTIKHLWWIPTRLIAPVSPTSASETFLIGYEYAPTGSERMLFDPEDVVHLRYGLDPDDPRRGLGPLGSLIREIFTDDEAANFTATLMRNSGVPGHMLSPDGSGSIDKKVADEAKSRWKQLFAGDNRGGLMVTSKATKLTQVGIDPDKLNLASIRQIPEERVTAVMGIPAAVVGLGTGLETTKVGATLKEFREQAWENTLIPIGQLIAEQIEAQLLRDFDEDTIAAFDLRNVRVLQDDETALAERVVSLVKAGVIKIEQAQAMLGFKPDTTQDFYQRNTLVFQPVRSGEAVITSADVAELEGGEGEGGSGHLDDPPTNTDDDEEDKDYPAWMKQAEEIGADE